GCQCPELLINHEHQRSTARMRRTPAAEDSSLVMRNRPNSPVCGTCGPPQISLLYQAPSGSPAVYTVTVAPYRSPNAPRAPCPKACSGDISETRMGQSRAMLSLTIVSMRASWAGATLAGWEK